MFEQKVSFSEGYGEARKYSLSEILTADEHYLTQTQIGKAMDELIANGRTSRYTSMQNGLGQK